MSVLTVGTNPVQVSFANPKRLRLVAQMLPVSVAAGNANAQIYGKWGSAPKADATSNTWDFVLVPGASDGTNTSGLAGADARKEDLWLIGSTTGLQVNVSEDSASE